MQEAYVDLTCPECDKQWEEHLNELPAPSETFECPDCREARPLSEFAHTARDLEVMREL